MAEKAIRSIRADKEVFERLGQMAKEGGLDQGAALEALLNTWDIQTAKKVVPERQADIEDYDAHLQGIQSAFLRSLELAQSAEDRAAARYRALLDARDQTIDEMTKRAERAEREREEARQEAQDLRAKVDDLSAVVEELRKRERLTKLLEEMADKIGAEAETTKRGKRKEKAKAQDVVEGEA